MKKRFFSISNLLLSSLIALLGLGACKTGKDVGRRGQNSKPVDKMRTVYGPPPAVDEDFQRRQEYYREQERQVREQEARRQREKDLRVVYGPPPVAYPQSGHYTPDADGVYDVAEVSPQFPEGEKALQQWLAVNMRYPADALAARKEGRVVVSFVVRSDGRIDGVVVLRSVSESLDAEAVRLIRSMPRWRAGRMAGRPVDCRSVLPVRFSLP